MYHVRGEECHGICGRMFPKNHVQALSQPYGEAGFQGARAKPNRLDSDPPPSITSCPTRSTNREAHWISRALHSLDFLRASSAFITTLRSLPNYVELQLLRQAPELWTNQLEDPRPRHFSEHHPAISRQPQLFKILSKIIALYN